MQFLDSLAITALAVGAALVGCGGSKPYCVPPPPGFDVVIGGDAALRSALVADANAGVARIEAFFGAPFARRFEFRVFDDRASLDVHWGERANDPDLRTECRMVGMGMADELSILSPARWRDQACDHDPQDSRAIAALVAHELVHTYHSQRNATVNDEAEAMAWFVEGLAVVASGQLADGHLAPAIEAVRAGAPAHLADAWKGKYRYGVSGSLVAYVDATRGRATIVRMLEARTPSKLLALLGLDEATLLERWRAWERARSVRP